MSIDSSGVGATRSISTAAGPWKIRVTTTPDVLTDDVADLGMGHLIADGATALRGRPFRVRWTLGQP